MEGKESANPLPALMNLKMKQFALGSILILKLLITSTQGILKISM